MGLIQIAMKRTAQKAARRALAAAEIPSRPLGIPRPSRVNTLRVNQARSFSSSRAALQEQQQGQQSQTKDKQKEKPEGEPEKEFTPGTSPFTIFVQVIREEIEKNRQLQDNIKTLEGSVSSVQDSKTWNSMRAGYEKARLAASIENNPRVKKAAEELINAGGKVNDAIAVAVTESYLYRGLSKSAQAMYQASEPLRQTEVYKQVAESVQEALSDVKYGGYVEKDARRQRREARLRSIGKGQKEGLAARAKAKQIKIDANPESVLSYCFPYLV